VHPESQIFLYPQRFLGSESVGGGSYCSGMSNLASAVDELLALDVDAMPGPALLAQIEDLARERNRLDAAYLKLLERADRTGAAMADHGSTQAWLRTSTRVTGTVAHRDVHLARDLADAFSQTAAALADGDITLAHAQVITGMRTAVGDEVVAKVEHHVVDCARTTDAKDIRRVVEHVRTMYGDRRRQRKNDQADYDDRALHATAGMYGNGLGKWQLHATGQETVMTAIHALSKPIAGDDRTAAQRRADALVTMAEIAMRSGELPTCGGVAPHITAVIPAATLADVPFAPAATYQYGATSGPDWARRYACDGEISRVITGPAGEILDSGRATRTFTAAQRRAIIVRDEGQCDWTGCDAPAAWCEVHHAVHWADGGSTSVDNGMLLCGRHHDRVHLFGHAIIKGPGAYRIDPTPGTDPTWQAKNKPPPESDP
jgi:hypothetical protein